MCEEASASWGRTSRAARGGAMQCEGQVRVRWSNARLSSRAGKRSKGRGRGRGRGVSCELRARSIRHSIGLRGLDTHAVSNVQKMSNYQIRDRFCSFVPQHAESIATPHSAAFPFSSNPPIVDRTHCWTCTLCVGVQQRARCILPRTSGFSRRTASLRAMRAALGLLASLARLTRENAVRACRQTHLRWRTHPWPRAASSTCQRCRLRRLRRATYRMPMLHSTLKQRSLAVRCQKIQRGGETSTRRHRRHNTTGQIVAGQKTTSSPSCDEP